MPFLGCHHQLLLFAHYIAKHQWYISSFSVTRPEIKKVSAILLSCFPLALFDWVCSLQSAVVEMLRRKLANVLVLKMYMKVLNFG